MNVLSYTWLTETFNVNTILQLKTCSACGQFAHNFNYFANKAGIQSYSIFGYYANNPVDGHQAEWHTIGLK